VPPEPQKIQQLWRQHGVVILAAFALLDADQHASAVDVVDLKSGNFGQNFQFHGRGSLSRLDGLAFGYGR
jgi:hypothetical protein